MSRRTPSPRRLDPESVPTIPMHAPAEPPTCSTCRHWRPVTGECHAGPPTILAVPNWRVEARWPQTPPGESCGAHQPREDARCESGPTAPTSEPPSGPASAT